MGMRKRIVKGGLLVGLSQIVILALSFGRNIIIARTVSLADMGIASTIALALTILEAASDLSANQLIVQAQDGDDPRLQANAHSFMIVRGVITAGILALAGGFLARLFNVPQATWAFQLMAVAPIIRGFTHQDLWRFHRHMRFWPLMITELFSQLVAFAAAWPLAAVVGDYSVMLWVILIQISVLVIGSHALRERRYQLRLDREQMHRIVAFGWPLLFNSVLILALNYGDRAMIAAFPAYSMADVGLYMVATSVVLMPTWLLQRTSGLILLPALAKAQADEMRFKQQFQKLTVLLGVAAVLQTILLTCLGPSLTVLCFGDQYLPATSFLGWLSAAAGVRVLRLSPTLGAMAVGDTRNPLIANIARGSGFVVAILAGLMGADLQWFAIASFVGELISYCVSLFSLAYRNNIRCVESVVSCALLLISIGLSMSLVRGGHGSIWMVASFAALVLGIVGAAFGLWFSVPIRMELRKLRSNVCSARV